MSHLMNAASTPYYKTEFPNEVTLYPISLNRDDNDVPNRFDSQLYLPIKNNEVTQCVEKLKKLNHWPENWDGYGAKPPKKHAINFAVNLVHYIFDISYTLRFIWSSPNVSADSNGDVLLEWWGKNNKKISLYISDNNQIEYIKSSTANISEMEDDVLNNFDVEVYQQLFAWLSE